MKLICTDTFQRYAVIDGQECARFQINEFSTKQYFDDVKEILTMFYKVEYIEWTISLVNIPRFTVLGEFKHRDEFYDKFVEYMI